MADVVREIEYLTSLPPSQHWFCPRDQIEDPDALYYDEDVAVLGHEDAEAKKIRKQKVAEANERKRQALSALQILAYNSEEADGLKARLVEHLKIQLSQCTVCVREYHRCRQDLKHELEEAFDADVVREFMQLFDQMNIDRIVAGLDSATATLMDTVPAERAITILPPFEMFALFETMHCTAMLRDEALLRDHFDQPFRLVQTKKKVFVPEYTPALISFLFSPNEERFAWALRSIGKLKRDMTAAEFDWAVRDTITAAMARVHIACIEKDFLPIFWRGALAITARLTKDLVTHRLRALDTDICRLALDHLQINFEGYTDIVSTLRVLLETAPGDVWDALAAVSPQTVVEQILNSPSIEQPMMTTEDADTQRLEVILAWVGPFIQSIKPANLAPVCRAILHQLMTRLQSDRFTRCARTLCFRTALRAMVQTLQIMNHQLAGSAVVADLLEIVKDPILKVLDDFQRLRGDMVSAEDHQLGLDAISSALALDCGSLSSTRKAISRHEALGHDINVSSLDIWKAAVRVVRIGDIPLTTAILIGTQRLLNLEPLTSKQSIAVPKIAEAWNNGYERACGYITELFEVLQDFEPQDLCKLLESPAAAQAFYATVFSGHPNIQPAAVTIVKAMSSADSRRDGIKYCIETSFTISMQALSNIFRLIHRAQIISPCRTFLKLAADVLDSLCSPQDGILRSKSLTGDDINATETAWQALWTVVSGTFDQTESWSLLGHDKAMMLDFCRDAMDFADQSFDQYSVIAGALKQDDSEETQELERNLLKVPQSASGRIVKWLRLRDDYLIAKSVSITTRVLGRLKEVGLQLSGDATLFIEDILTGTTKSRLTPGQKSELRRALDSHLGLEAQEESDSEADKAGLQKSHKQGVLSSWVTSGSSRSASPATPLTSNKAGINFDAWKSAAQAQKDKPYDESVLKSIVSRTSSTAEAAKARANLANKVPGLLSKKAAPQPDAGEFRRKRQAEEEARKKQNAAIIAAAKRKSGLADAGSGLAGIGVEGKDYTTKGQGVMVSDESSEDDDDDGGLDAELFGITKPKKRIDTVRRDAAGAIGLKREQKQGPVRLQRQARSAKDMRARLAPDLSPLHKTILGWDFFHEGDYPPNSHDWEYKKVSNTFRHVGDYQETFRPLLTLEAWQSFLRAREESTFKPFEIKIVSRSSVDAFVELGSSISFAENKEIQISESDIILFSTAENPANSPDAPHCFSRVYRMRRQKGQLEVTYRVLPGSSILPQMTPGSLIYGTKIQSITPLEREYGALLALQYYDLCDYIIKARPSPLLNYTDKQLQPIIDNYTLNLAQAKAVQSAHHNDAFTLIQGPPGSGKTKTITAIVGALLSDSLADGKATTRIEIPKGTGMQTSMPSASKKLLVCAPSNAAVDELVMRLKEGVKTLKGVHKSLNVVRLGRSDAINSSVFDVTMDELVNKRLGTVNGDNEAREKTTKLMKEHQLVSQELNLTRDKLNNAKGKEGSAIQDEFNALRRRKMQLGTQIDNAKDAEGVANRGVDMERKKVQQQVLNEAHVICATLSGSGHDMFQSLQIEFETVIVDEAAQCVEMSALIPLKYGCTKCILVGDPRQLPPTVFSKVASANKYEQSLFVRMQENFPDAVHLLDTQYRMHPDISVFPSTAFYEGKLLDGANMAELRKKPWHSSELLAPYRFFDVQGQHQAAPKGHSLVNLAEIDVALALYNRLIKDYSNLDFNSKIGIITPYKSQLRLLKERFSSRYGPQILDTVEFNTTDAFQGRESEVIIFSCVRASPAGNVGFLSDIRRMNVGITRAKSSLWILGNSQSLMRGEYWAKLITDAHERHCHTSGDVLSMLRGPSSNFPAKPRPAARKAIAQPPAKQEAPKIKQEQNGTAMEGIRVQLSDKLASVRADAKPGNTLTVIKTEDVKMAVAASEAATPKSVDSASSTKPAAPTAPAPATDGNGNDKAPIGPPSGAAQPRNPGLVGKTPVPIIRKRKAADPFLPKKRR